jgi:hypothetical protein
MQPRPPPGAAEPGANDIPYDTKSAFSITINTAGPSLASPTTIEPSVSEFAKLAKDSYSMSDDEARSAFGKAFRAPGTSTSSIRPRSCSARGGLTELATAMMVMAA